LKQEGWNEKDFENYLSKRLHQEVGVKRKKAICNVVFKPGEQMNRKIFRILALVLLVAAVGVWLATGASRGWSKTSVPIKKSDEVTGITYDQYEKRFIAGVDFLGAALLGAGVLVAASFLFHKKPTQTSNQ
jgi:hypothetical protein